LIRRSEAFQFSFEVFDAADALYARETRNAHRKIASLFVGASARGQYAADVV
jgi:hypothetical protein